MANWYCGSTKYVAVSLWAALTTYSVGQIVRQLATPTVGNERCFRISAITTGISGATEPSWTLTKNGTTTDVGVTWTECTGQAIYNGDGGGTAWAAPHARIANAVITGWPSAGDTIYVSNNHAATQAAPMIIAPNGSINAPLNIICVSDAVVPPTTLATTASETTTGANNMTIGNNSYGSINCATWYGINFNIGTGSGSSQANFQSQAAGNSFYTYVNCSFNLGYISSADCTTGFGQTLWGNYHELRNCSFTFTSSNQYIVLFNNDRINFIACTFAASGSSPASLFEGSFASIIGLCTVSDSDLSNITGNLVGSSSSVSMNIIFENCKIASGVNPNAISWASTTSSGEVKMHNCDSAGTNYRYYDNNYLGTVVQETTIVRSGGATNGTTPISWNITTNSAPTFLRSFATDGTKEMAQWNNVSGTPQTATIYLTSNTALDNSKIWLEIEYPSSLSSPLGATVSTKMAIFGTPVSLTSDTSTWGGSALTNKYSITTPSFTPQMVGPIKARIYVAVPSATIYVDPLLVL